MCGPYLSDLQAEVQQLQTLETGIHHVRLEVGGVLGHVTIT